MVAYIINIRTCKFVLIKKLIKSEQILSNELAIQRTRNSHRSVLLDSVAQFAVIFDLIVRQFSLPFLIAAFLDKNHLTGTCMSINVITTHFDATTTRVSTHIWAFTTIAQNWWTVFIDRASQTVLNCNKSANFSIKKASTEFILIV